MRGARLDRWLAQHGLGSRKEVSRWIRQGRVRVNGEAVRSPDARVPEGARVEVDGDPVKVRPEVVRWHKPVGVLTSVGDPWGRPDLTTAVPELLGWGLHPVGRLDQDTSGLLLFSADGALTQGLLHPRRAVPRTYLAQVETVPEGLVERLRSGVETSDGVVCASDAQVAHEGVRITVSEGKHRMVRRMLANAGAPCVGLHREAYGSVSLGGLPEGEWEPVSGDALNALRGWADGSSRRSDP